MGARPLMADQLPLPPALPAAAYAGRYRNAYVGDAIVEPGADGRQRAG